jgi:hypothetical protein
MSNEIIQLLSYDGPNVRGPQPGVFLKVRSGGDNRRRLREALKDGAQKAGLVLGYLEVDAEPTDVGFLIRASFTTPTPALGAELARYAVEALNRAEAGDEEWDAEAPLWDLAKRRRAEALPLQVVQLAAEATTRGVPWFVRTDGQVQLGYGARGWAFDPSQFARAAGTGTLAAGEVGVGPAAPRLQAAPDVPWERVGPIPIVAVAGGVACDIAAGLIAATLHAQKQSVVMSTKVDFDATRELLTDPAAAIAVAGLAAEGIARRGLAFERCAYSAVVDLPRALPPEVADREELARVLGVPMLVTDAEGRVALNADVPEIVALAEYAPCPVIYISAAEENAIVGFHRAEGGQALFVRQGMVIAASGASEQAVAAATLPPELLPGALAGLALLWAMGLTWEQITFTSNQKRP